MGNNDRSNAVSNADRLPHDEHRTSVHLSTVYANRIRHRIATVNIFDDSALATASADCSVAVPPRRRCNCGPLVMLLHGWPESWYSFRHQLVALSSAGYPACAPDMRGYGGTDAPTSVEDYRTTILSRDVVEIAKSLGHDAFVVVGHDFGSYLAWRVAILHPSNVLGVVGLSVPYSGLSPKRCGVLASLKKRKGDPTSPDLEERAAPKFQYMLHHTLPYAAEEYDRNCFEALYRLYAYCPRGEHVPGTPEVTDPRMFPPEHRHRSKGSKGEKGVAEPLDARSAPGQWARLPKLKSLPQWLARSDLEFYVSEYDRNGFAGGLAWYRALDINWEDTKSILSSTRVEQPVLYLAGDEDNVVLAEGGPDAVRRRLAENCSDLKKCKFYVGCGHWIQQERADDVCEELLFFLGSLKSNRKDLPDRIVSEAKKRGWLAKL